MSLQTVNRGYSMTSGTYQSPLLNKNIVSHSQKGGVGKTYVAVNLAVAFYELLSNIDRILAYERERCDNSPDHLKRLNLYKRMLMFAENGGNGIPITGVDLDSTGTAWHGKFSLDTVVHQFKFWYEVGRVSRAKEEEENRKEAYQKHMRFIEDVKRMYELARVFAETEDTPQNRKKLQFASQEFHQLLALYADAKIEPRNFGNLAPYVDGMLSGIRTYIRAYHRDANGQMNGNYYGSLEAAIYEAVGIGLHHFENAVATQLGTERNTEFNLPIEDTRNIVMQGKGTSLGFIGGEWKEGSVDHQFVTDAIRNNFISGLEVLCSVDGYVIFDSPPGGMPLNVYKRSIKQDTVMVGEITKRGGRVIEIIRGDEDPTDTIEKTNTFLKNLDTYKGMDTGTGKRRTDLGLIFTAVEGSTENERRQNFEERLEHYKAKIITPLGITITPLGYIPKADCSIEAIERRGSLFVLSDADNDVPAANAVFNIAADLMGIKAPGEQHDYVELLRKDRPRSIPKESKAILTARKKPQGNLLSRAISILRRKAA